MTATIESAQEMDTNRIKEILPHRYPFLLVDRVTNVEAGVRATGFKNLTANEEFFQGHFPFRPIMPGVLQVEALAQLACVCMLLKPEYKEKLGVFTGIDGFKFKGMVVPGDRLDLEIEIIKVRGIIGKARGTAKVAGKLVCEGELGFAIVDK